MDTYTTTSGTLVPVHRSGKPVAWALVDDDSASAVAESRWLLHSSGSVVRNRRVGTRVVTEQLARVVLGLPVGRGPRVAHVNGDRLDNRRGNLRISPRWLGRHLVEDDSLLELLQNRLAGDQPREAA